MLNKRILLAGLLSVGVIAGMVYFHNNVLSPKTGQGASTSTVSAGEESAEGTAGGGSGRSGGEASPTGPEHLPDYLSLKPAAETTESSAEGSREVILETELYRAAFSSRGGVLTSLVLKDFKDSAGNPVELVGSGDESENTEEDYPPREPQHPFRVLFSHPTEIPTDRDTAEVFSIRQTASRGEVTFSREYLDPRDNPFLLEKTYTFLPGEYLFRLTIGIRPLEKKALSGEGNYLYDLTLGPGMGPPYEKQKARTDYRYFTLLGETPKKKNYLTTENKLREITEQVRWAGFHGQYFAAVVMPSEKVPRAGLYLDSRTAGDLSSSGTVHFTVPFRGDEVRTDEYYCFFGPKIPSILARYSNADQNGFGLENAELSQLNTTNTLLGTLALFFGKIILALKRMVPNYGLAVLLFTLIVRLLTSPLSYRNFRSYKKLQALRPKIARIRKKHEFNPAEAHRQIMELYQQEHINSLGRLLPLLIQLPIIVALFQLFSRSFEFRSAPFIPGWIDSLSQAEQIAVLPFSIPVLGSSLRLLPLVMLAVTVVQIHLTQPPDSESRGQRIMAYATPVLVFIILYHMPSGIVLYWLFYNLLGLGEYLLFEKKYASEEGSGASGGKKDRSGRGRVEP
jgi:YidC/Oxa1 family membrane protein insertase